MNKHTESAKQWQANQQELDWCRCKRKNIKLNQQNNRNSNYSARGVWIENRHRDSQRPHWSNIYWALIAFNQIQIRIRIRTQKRMHKTWNWIVPAMKYAANYLFQISSHRVIEITEMCWQLTAISATIEMFRNCNTWALSLSRLGCIMNHFHCMLYPHFFCFKNVNPPEICYSFSQ